MRYLRLLATKQKVPNVFPLKISNGLTSLLDISGLDEWQDGDDAFRQDGQGLQMTSMFRSIVRYHPLQSANSRQEPEALHV